MKFKAKYDWGEIEKLAEHLTAEEIIDYLKLKPVGKESLQRIERLVREKHLKAKYNAKLQLKNKAVKGDMGALKTLAAYEEPEADGGEWITQAQYARKYHLTRSAVTQAVNSGRLYRNSAGLVNGAEDCRSYEFDLSGTADMRELKAKKIEAETQILLLRMEEEREKIRLDAQMELLKELHGKYEYLRVRLRNLNLSVEQVKELDAVLLEYEAGLKA